MEKQPDQPLAVYTLPQVAERLNVSVRTLRRAIDLGYVDVIRFGRLMRINETELARITRDGWPPT